MSWHESLATVDNDNFAIELGRTAGTSAFFRAAKKTPAVSELVQVMRTSGEATEAVLDRLDALAALEIDPRYENPNDAALAALLWSVGASHPEMVLAAAEVVYRARQCWYSKKLAGMILSPAPTDSGNTWAYGGLMDYVGASAPSDHLISSSGMFGLGEIFAGRGVARADRSDAHTPDLIPGGRS